MKIFSTYLLVFLLPLFLSAQPGTKITTDPVAILDAYYEQALNEWGVPGFSVVVIDSGQVILSKGYGELELNQGTAPDGETLYAIASNTKAFVATALAILVDEGKIDWDDPVQTYLPYFELYDDYVSRHTTIRDLLCHRVGLGTFSGDAIWYKNEKSAEQIIRQMKYVPQAFDFRAGYGYSNLMYITAGEVIRVVAGKPWDEFVHERIFEPLGMDRTRTHVADLSTMDNVATPHKPGPKGNVAIDRAPWENSGAAGGIWSSTNDLAKWLQLHFNRGVAPNGDTIFSRQNQLVTQTPHNSFLVSDAAREAYPTRNFSAYGLGWGLSDLHGEKVLAHGGGYDGMYSRVTMVPERGIGIVVLTNSMRGLSTPLAYYTLDLLLSGETPTDYSAQGLPRQHKRDLAFQKRMDDLANTRSKKFEHILQPKEVAGTYHAPIYGTIRIDRDKKDLSLHFEHAPALTADLIPFGPDTYEIDWREAHAWFTFGTVEILHDGKTATGLKFRVPNEDIFFEEIEPVRQ